MSSYKAQLDSLEKDLKGFGNIDKLYTDQLVHVKVQRHSTQDMYMLTVLQLSDMANNDLEKYAKALDRWVFADNPGACD